MIPIIRHRVTAEFLRGTPMATDIIKDHPGMRIGDSSSRIGNASTLTINKMPIAGEEGRGLTSSGGR
jgi:hypothetical protein